MNVQFTSIYSIGEKSNMLYTLKDSLYFKDLYTIKLNIFIYTQRVLSFKKGWRI